MATTDPDVATKLASERLDELEAARRRRALRGRADIATLAEQAAAYLVARKRAGVVTTAWLAACQGFLERATAFFGADKPLEQVRVSDVRAWAAHLLSEKGKTGKVLGAESVRRHLFTLSAVYRFAQESELLPPGFNPVAVLREKPREFLSLDTSAGAITTPDRQVIGDPRNSSVEFGRLFADIRVRNSVAELRRLLSALQ